MTLSKTQLRDLKGRCHGLSPVVTVADKGLTENVLTEVETALNAHELIKVKLRGDRETRRDWVSELVETTRAELVQQIGQVACLFRRNPDRPRIDLA
jgi:RNA-binding protein